MSISIAYQVNDTTSKKEVLTTEKSYLDASNSSILQTEVIEPLRSNKIKLEQPEKIKDTVFYGFRNNQNIPIRQYEIKNNLNYTTQIKQLFKPDLKPHPIANWQTLLLIFTVLLMGLVKAFNGTRFKQTYRSLFNYRIAQEVCGEEKVFFHRVNIILTLIYLIIISLFIYNLRDVLNNINSQDTSWSFYLSIFGFLLLINVGKLIFSQFFSFLFDVPYLITEYTYNIALFNNMLGVLMIPVLCIMYYTTLDFSFTLIYLAIPILLLAFLMRMFRLFIIGISKRVSYFYIFLYICTLEILPLVVMIKIFILK